MVDKNANTMKKEMIDRILWESKWLMECKYELANDWQNANVMRREMIDRLQMLWEGKWLTDYKCYEKGNGWWKKSVH